MNNNFTRIFFKFGLWLGTLFFIILIGISNVFAQTIQGWAKNVYLYTDVNLLDCTSSSCSTSITLTPDYFYDSENIVKYNYFYSNSHTIANYGDMILNFHRYLPGYLYSSTSYVCFSSNVTLSNSNIDLYVGSYSDTINKVGNLAYHNVLVQSLDNHPYSPGDQYNKCYAIVNLFSPSVEGQNIGKVYKSPSSVSSRTYLIGEDYQSLGIYSGSLNSVINSAISNSNLASAQSVQDVQDAITQMQSDIINTQNQNTQDIIDAQNQNTQDQIESQRACTKIFIDKNNIVEPGKYLTSNGSVSSSSVGNGITDYIKIKTYSTITRTSNASNEYMCFYDSSKTKISCHQNRSDLSVPSNASYARFTINANTNIPTFEIETCQNGNQAIVDSQQELNDTLNNDDTSDATNQASDFFSDFNTNTFGLTSIITSPLNLIQSLTSSSCTPLHLPLPYLNNKYLDLPCMDTIYQQYFGTFFTMYQTITFGIIAYWVIVRIFNYVKDFKNPEHDEIEVVDL